MKERLRKVLVICGGICAAGTLLVGSLFLLAEGLFYFYHNDFYVNRSRLTAEQQTEESASAWDLAMAKDFTMRRITLENASFEQLESNGFLQGWKVEAKAVSHCRGYSTESRGVIVEEGRIGQKIRVADLPPDVPLIVSAWIRSGDKHDAYVELQTGGGAVFQRFHPGDGAWRLVSVVLNREHGHTVKQELVVRVGSVVGRASFDEVSFVLGRPQTILPKMIGKESRYRECINDAPKNRFRILTLGGSATYCHSLFYESWPYLLEQKLNSQEPARYDVINFGSCGYSTIDLLKYVNAPAEDGKGYLSLDPDLVIICPVWNDWMHAYARHEQNAYDLNQYLRRNWLIKHTALGYYVYKKVYAHFIEKRFEAISQELASQEHWDEDSIEESTQLVRVLSEGYERSLPFLAFETRLHTLIDIFQDHGVKVVLLTKPGVWLADSDFRESKLLMKRYGVDEATMPEAMIKVWLLMEEMDTVLINRVAKNENVPCVDFTTYYKEAYPTVESRVQHFQDGTHFNGKGCNIFSDYILNADEFQKVLQ